jgi:hypothetical protein
MLIETARTISQGNIMRRILTIIFLFLCFHSFSQEIITDSVFQKTKKGIIKRLDTILPQTFHVIETDIGFLVYYYDENLQYTENEKKLNAIAEYKPPSYTNDKETLIKNLPRNLFGEPYEGMVMNDLYDTDPLGTYKMKDCAYLKYIKSYIKEDEEDFEYYLLDVNFAKKWPDKKIDSVIKSNDSLYVNSDSVYHSKARKYYKRRKPTIDTYLMFSPEVRYFYEIDYTKIPFKSANLNYSIFITEHDEGYDKITYRHGIPMFISLDDTKEAVKQLIFITLGIN